MNKKIKIIDLLVKIAKGEDVPKKIKCFSDEYIFCDMCKCYEDEFSQDLVIKWNKLNDEVEILEDNTEEIEELDKFDIQGLEVSGYSMTQAEYLLEDGIEENRQKINELVRAIKEIRKDLNNGRNK